MAQAGRRKIVGGNWKMNTTLDDAVELAQSLTRRIGEISDVDVVLCPPFPNLDAVNRVIAGSTLQLGAQNVFWEPKGAYTGEVSASMLVAVGCSWVIVGHSERRHIMGESNEVVNRKLRAALDYDLQVILAVGETGDERHEGRTQAVLEDQLHGSLESISMADMERIVIAYEPLWAIGTGETATPDQAREAHGFVRLVLDRLYTPEVAAATRVQYGGSVVSGNCSNLMSQPGVDGALVGGASLKPDDFVLIVEAARQG